MKRLILLLTLSLNIFIFAAEKEMASKYFRVVYDANYETEAIELVKSADVIAEKEFNFFNFIPSEKITIILRDITDEENAYTLDNTILLYPNSINTFELEKTYDNWYLYAFTHELTHVIINRKVGGLFKVVPLFKYNLHQAFLPSWYQEGIAIYAEVKFTDDLPSGRELSNKFDMNIKHEVLNRDFTALTFANGLYPNNNNYTHGYSFIKFFVETYGENALKDVIEEASNHQIMQPFEAFLDIAEINTEEEMYRVWFNYLNTKYKSKNFLREGIKLENISAGIKRNLHAYNGELYYTDFNQKENEEKKGIFKYNLGNHEEIKITNDLPVDNFSVANNSVYFSSLMYNPIDQTTFAESYQLEAKNKKKTKYRKPESLNIDRAINFIYLDNELAYVYRDKEKLGLKTTSGKLLISPNEGYLFQKFFYDELNDYIYFAATKLDEKVSYIYEFNISNYEIKKIIKGYSPFIEGNNLYFENSINGTYNIFKYNFDTQIINQITNVQYGAFEPQVADRTLYFLNYIGNEFTINQLSKEEFYNRKVDPTDFDEKNGEDIEKKEIIERSFDVEDLKIKRFKNEFEYRYGYLIPGELALTYSDVLWERFITIGASSYLTGMDFTDRETDIYYGLQEDNKENGLFVNYIDSKFELYAEASPNSYAKISYTHPIMGKDRNSWMFTKVSFDKNNEKSLEFYAKKDFFFLTKEDTFGFKRIFDDEDSDLNELYLESPSFSLKYFRGDDVRPMKGALEEEKFINLDGFALSQMRYNLTAKNLVIAKTTVDKVYPSYKGTVSGTISMKDYTPTIDFYYVAWGTKKQVLVSNAYINGNGFIFTDWPLSVSTGLISQFDIINTESVKDSTTLYLKYIFRF